MLHILSVDGQTCYDALTYCTNWWRWCPFNCNPSLSVTLPDIYSNYCYPNDIILWKNGINDGSSSLTNMMIDYNFIICQDETFSVCGYVPLKSIESLSECGQVLENSGVLFGTGIDLTFQTNTSLSSLGASIQTLEIMKDYYGLKGSIAAETICNKPFIIDETEAYDLSVSLMDEYVTEVQKWYEAGRSNNSLSFIELPLGIRTVMTSVYWEWGHFSLYPMFWTNIILNNFENAIKELRSWYDNGATDKRLSAKANVLQASLGCITNNNLMDIVFLLDTSGSVGSDHFDVAKNWVTQFIQYFDETNLNSGAVRFGVATFSTDYIDWIHLDEYRTFDEYKTNILSITYDSGGTYLGNALIEIGVNQFVISNGMRESLKGAGRLLIVLTDGDSSDDVDQGIKSLNNLNLNIIVIGIGSYNMEQLQQITIQNNIYGIDTYPDLDTILSGIMIKTCYIPTQLNINNNAVIKDITVQKYGIQYFELFSSNNNENVMLNITQNIGCIYIYISYSIQYPSYFINDIQFTSCSQSFKQIILSPPNQTNIYIAIEGRNDDSLYSIDIGECNKTVCKIGTNYNPKLNNDSPYSFDEKASMLLPILPSIYRDEEDTTIIFTDLYQPSVTKTPIFVVSILLGIVILIWASLHFLCNGLDICKNSGVGDMMEVKKGIFYSGRNKFMSFISVVLIIWELGDFILDLITTIGIFIKGQDPNIDTSLYNKCGTASLFAFIASVLLFFGKIQLWKKFYPQINEHREAKIKNVESMENIKKNGNDEFDCSGYKEKWNEYYMNQKKIGLYLGDLIMYDLFGVALEDCIQITVTWYIKNDLFFSKQNGFMSAWLWLTFIASLLSVSFKLFRALLLKLGCHHDSYRADLKPKGYELVTDLQPIYIDNKAPLLDGIKNLNLIQPKNKKYKEAEYKEAEVNSDDDDDNENDDWFSNELKKVYESLYHEMKENEWSPHIDAIHKKIEIYIQEWGQQQLDKDESIKNKIQEQAINDAAKKENMRIIDEMEKKGIDALKYYNKQNKNVTHQELYEILSVIQKTAFVTNGDDIKMEETDDEMKYVKDTESKPEIYCFDEIQKEYEKQYMLEWTLQELKKNKLIKQEQIEKAMDEIASSENQRIIDHLIDRKGIDATKYVQNETPRQAYSTLLVIQKQTIDSSITIDHDLEQ